MKRALLVLLAACDSGSVTLAPSDATGGAITEVAFSDTSVGQQAAVVVHVTNKGTQTSGPLAVAITGAAANDFVLDNTLTTCAGQRLGRDGTCDIALVFRPTAGGDRDATLVVTSDPGGTLELALRGHAFVPDLHFNPPAIAFGTVAVGQMAQTTIELRNDGTSPVAIDSIGATGAGFSRGSTTCGSALDAGSSCDVVVIASPTALGALAGQLTVVSSGAGTSAMLTASGARQLTVVRDGTGTGTITSSPSGIDCGATCVGLFEGDVTLSAAPGAGSQLVSWSIAGCGQSDTCTIAADLVPIEVHVSFALVGSAAVMVSYAGSGTGDVQVRRETASGPIDTTCFASCTVPIEPGELITVGAATPGIFGGLTGACSDSGTGTCSFTAPTGTSAVTARFDKVPNEQWTRFVTGRVLGVAHDSAGNVLVATLTALTKLSPTGSTVWSRALPASAVATGPGDTIYVVSGTDLKKLDASSADVWTRPLDANSTTTCGDGFEPEQCLAVGADGAAVVHSTIGVTRWDTDGKVTFSTAVAQSTGGVAIDAAGIVYVATAETIIPGGEGRDARRFQPNGTELTPFSRTSNQGEAEFGIDSAGQLVTSSSGHGNNHFTRLHTDGTQDYAVFFDGTFPGGVDNGLATSASGLLAWWYFTLDFTGPHHVQVFTNAGAVQYQFDRASTTVDGIVLGVVPATASLSATGGQLVLAGRFETFNSQLGLVQAVAP
jgi:HYDIN/CFA65/VesB family protein